MSRPPSVVVREARPEEFAAVGALTVAAYAALPGSTLSGGYEAELRDVAGRAAEAVVLVAVDESSEGTPARPLGGVTYVPDEDGASEGTPARPLGAVAYIPDEHSSWGEGVRPGEASIRMLAVIPVAQGRGIGEALTRACIDRARAAGKRAVVLHSTPWMTSAHRLYERLGFRRAPDRDWLPVPDVPLWAFELALEA